MPGDAGHSRHRAELVHDVARQEVDVVVAQRDAGVPDSFPPQLVQLGILHPLHALGNGWLVQVQLQLFHQLVEVARMECHHVFGYAIGLVPRAAAHRLEDAHGSCGEPVEALAHVVRVALGAVLEEHLPGLGRPGQVAQLAQLAPTGPRRGHAAVALVGRPHHLRRGHHLLARPHPQDRAVIALLWGVHGDVREGPPGHGEAQEGAALEQRQEVGEEAAHFLVHCAHQAHLVQRPRPVRAAAVRPLHHFLELGHGGGFNVRLAAQHAALDHQVWVVLSKVVHKVWQPVRCTVHNAHHVAGNARRILVERLLEEVLGQACEVTGVELGDLVPVEVEDGAPSVGVHLSAHKASQPQVAKVQREGHARHLGAQPHQHRRLLGTP